MTLKQALAIAKRYVTHLNQTTPLSDDFEWVVGEVTEYAEAWHFAPDIAHRWRPMTDQDVFMGSPAGLLLWKQKLLVSLVSWQEVPEELYRDTLGAQAADLATALLAGPFSSVALRRHLRLSVHEMVDFLEELAHAEDQEKRELLTARLYKQALQGLLLR